MRTVITISMPESLRLYLANRIKSSNYSSVSEYIRELVRADQERENAKSNEQFDREMRFYAQRRDRQD